VELQENGIIKLELNKLPVSLKKIELKKNGLSTLKISQSLAEIY